MPSKQSDQAPDGILDLLLTPCRQPTTTVGMLSSARWDRGQVGRPGIVGRGRLLLTSVVLILDA